MRAQYCRSSTNKHAGYLSYRADSRDGLGSAYYKSGQLKYVGEWREGSPEGNGTYLALNGDKYEGRFRRGVITGPGKITQTNGNSRVLEDSETIQFRNSNSNKYLDLINTLLQYLGLENFFQKYRTFYDNFIWPNLPG